MKGIYLLIMRLDADVGQLAIGRLGRFDFAAGYYLYVGSAFGSGGIVARLAHHERMDKAHQRWHVDYLREHAVLVESWSVATGAHLEAGWANRLAAAPELSIPAPGFGASDSDAASHLLYCRCRPARQLIVETLMDCLFQAHSTECTVELRDYQAIEPGRRSNDRG